MLFRAVILHNVTAGVAKAADAVTTMRRWNTVMHTVRLEPGKK